MPTYQYACTECGHQLEAVQSFSDPALTDCPACEGRLRKLFSSVGIVFKGSGFYRTDSRNGNGSTTAKDGAKDSAPTKDGSNKDGSNKDSSKDSTSASSSTSASTPSGSGSGSSGSASGGGNSSKATAAA